MLPQQCEQCGTAYGSLQRAGENNLFACKECGREFCERCAVREASGPQVWFIRCPNCSWHSLGQLNLTHRFSIYSCITDLTKAPHVIALLFVPWSPYAKRNESLINESIPRLRDFDPTFFLLNEDDTPTRKAVSNWYPAICNPNMATGNGAVIWLCKGQPVESLYGGPYLAKLEILDRSRMAWS